MAWRAEHSAAAVGSAWAESGDDRLFGGFADSLILMANRLARTAFMLRTRSEALTRKQADGDPTELPGTPAADRLLRFLRRPLAPTNANTCRHHRRRDLAYKAGWLQLLTSAIPFQALTQVIGRLGMSIDTVFLGCGGGALVSGRPQWRGFIWRSAFSPGCSALLPNAPGGSLVD